LCCASHTLFLFHAFLLTSFYFSYFTRFGVVVIVVAALYNFDSIQFDSDSSLLLISAQKGVRKPPDKRFSKALSSSSAQYEKLYPSLAGPTMILNLPFLLQAFASFFKPLFPKSIQVKLKFLRAPVLGSLRDLTPLALYNGRQKKAFLVEIEKLLKQ